MVMKQNYQHYQALFRYYNLKCTEMELVLDLHHIGETMSQLEARQDTLARHQINIRRFTERNETVLSQRPYFK